MNENIDTGDTVLHVPSGETWIVAGAAGAHLWPCGWPPGRANVSDCVLLIKATPQEKANLQAQLKRMPHDDERRQFAANDG